MRYKNIVKGTFINRPNRFIANVDIEGAPTVCHVKNTGRCRELLIPGATVFLEKSDNPERKTQYDLIAVYKEENLFNIDSQAPNKVFGEWLTSGKSCFESITNIKPECKYGNSRFDFYIEADGRKIFAEVKGVTLENDGILSFPDAPTERGTKHIRELCDCIENGYEAVVAFVIQTKNAKYFTPNADHDPAFAQELKNAHRKGVRIIALCCDVTSDSLSISDYTEVRL